VRGKPGWGEAKYFAEGWYCRARSQTLLNQDELGKKLGIPRPIWYTRARKEGEDSGEGRTEKGFLNLETNRSNQVVAGETKVHGQAGPKD